MPRKLLFSGQHFTVSETLVVDKKVSETDYVIFSPKAKMEELFMSCQQVKTLLFQE